MEPGSAAADLPADYLDRLAGLNLIPAWTLLRGVMGVGGPDRVARPAHWPFAALRREMLVAGDIVPVEKAERRVLGLCNPGYPAGRMSTTPTFFLGLQLILPGERAPNHRHSPAAARFIVEGRGAFTTVDGERLDMDVGDLVITPPQTAHDHGHEGTGHMMWLDILDHPVAVPLDVSYVVPGSTAYELSNAANAGDTVYRCAGLVPYRSPLQKPPAYPLKIFKWQRVKKAADASAAAAGRDEAVHLRYINPETGDSVLQTLNFSIRVLRPGEEIAPGRSSASMAFYVVGGDGESEIDAATYRWSASDALACPTYARIRHRNASSSKAAYLLQIDDVPLQHKLGFYEEVPDVPSEAAP